MNLRKRLVSIFSSEDYEPLRTKDLANKLKLKGADKIRLYEIIDNLLDEQIIKMSKRGKIKAYINKINTGSGKNDKKISSGENLLTGTIIGNQKGFAFFKADLDNNPAGLSNISSEAEGANKPTEDIFINPDDLSNAMHGDRVKIKITGKADPASGRKATGKVVEIVKRNPEPIIGLYIVDDLGGYVRPDRKQYSRDIIINKEDANGALDGDKVIVQIIDDYQDDRANSMGDVPIFARVLEVIGHAGDKGVDISSIAAQFSLPYKFSEECLKEADRLGKEVSVSDMMGRKDLRDLLTVTIDGADAKDFDDAISLEEEGENFRLYIHIADVSHYVKENTAMDKEAYERGNSVYLLDRVIPMLPQALSNGLCSLNPGKDRLTMTTEVLLNSKGQVLDHSFYESIISSDYRLVYRDVSDYIENAVGYEGKAELRSLLSRMKIVYEGLAEKSRQRGSLDFDLPETELVLDENGVPTSVFKQERRVANRIIEEFMILNNVLVAEYFHKKNLPFIYRIHEQPTVEGIERLNRCLFAISYPILDREKIDPKKIRELLAKAEGKDEQDLLHNTVLRSMTKAIYSREAKIHFGLALKHYSHFTAPIRRYSDIIAHRFLKDILKGRGQNKKAVAKLSDQCRHISECEEAAQEAERDVVDMKSAEYMQQFIGQEFEGKISSLTSFGIFVMLENTIEGLIHFRTMNDDYYRFDEDRMIVVGERSKREFHYGQKLRIKVAAANPLLREIDFSLIDQSPYFSRPKQYKKAKSYRKKTGSVRSSRHKGSKTEKNAARSGRRRKRRSRRK